MKTLIVIPARMASTRFPNKPMALIDNKPMIVHVWKRAIESNLGKVIVACSEKEVADCINGLGGEAILTNPNLPSGTDRVYAAIENIEDFLLTDCIINLQGDMPIINSQSIKQVINPIVQGYDISTLVTSFSGSEEKNDLNITKAEVKWIKKEVIGEAVNFHKDIKKIGKNNIYHHVGIYGFKPEALKQFIYLSPSDKENELKLEQMRALDNNMTIGVSYVKNVPISVDTKEDLKKVENIIKKTK